MKFVGRKQCEYYYLNLHKKKIVQDITFTFPCSHEIMSEQSILDLFISDKSDSILPRKVQSKRLSILI